ncbi:hypothetical protein [Vibrio taketomensis]|nr:hypothetical protein [Vibrio taketomensis]
MPPINKRTKAKLAIKLGIRETYKEFNDAIRGELNSSVSTTTFDKVMENNSHLVKSFVESTSNLLLSSGMSDDLSDDIVFIMMDGMVGGSELEAIWSAGD